MAASSAAAWLGDALAPTQDDALAPTQGMGDATAPTPEGTLKLCTFNAACMDDQQLSKPKRWQAYKDHLAKTLEQIKERSNMLCLQEVAPKVWDFLTTTMGWVGHRHETQNFAIMWDPEVTA